MMLWTVYLAQLECWIVPDRLLDGIPPGGAADAESAFGGRWHQGLGVKS